MRLLINVVRVLSYSILSVGLIGCADEADKPCRYEVYKNGSENFFVYKWNWGINGNNQTIVITPVKLLSRKEINKERDYIYEGAFPVFLKLKKDSLLIYTYKKSQVPLRKKADQTIIHQIEIDNSMNMKLREDLYSVNLEEICKPDKQF